MRDADCNPIWSFDDYVLDPNRLLLLCGDRAIHVEPQALSLLILLIEKRFKVVTKDEIVQAIWGNGSASDASIANKVYLARAAIGDNGLTQQKIRTAHGKGFQFIAKVKELRTSPYGVIGPCRDVAGPAPPRTSIEVMPFMLVGLQGQNAGLVEVIRHDLTRAISRLRWIDVIAGSGQQRSHLETLPRDPDTSGGQADYCISGLLYERGGEIRVHVQIVDCGRGQVLWADVIRTPLQIDTGWGGFIEAQVVSALEIHVPDNEVRKAKEQGIQKSEAWLAYHMGMREIYRFTETSTLTAKALFKRAIEIDPHLARAHSGLSFAHFLDAFLDIGRKFEVERDLCRRHAERALEIDPLDSFGHFVLGRSFWLHSDASSSFVWLERAVQLNPNYAQGFYSLALSEMLLGRTEDSEKNLQISETLAPLDPLRYAVHGTRALLNIQLGDVESARNWSNRAAMLPGAHYLISVISSVANLLDGREEQALYWAGQARSKKPDFSSKAFFTAIPMSDDAGRRQVHDALKKIGF